MAKCEGNFHARKHVKLYIKTYVFIFYIFGFLIKYLCINDEEKNMSCTWTTIKNYYNKLQKNCFKIHSYEKNSFGKKDIQSFSKIIMLAHCISFAPKSKEKIKDNGK